MTFSDIFVLRLPVNVIHFMENGRQTMAGRQKIKMLRPNIHVSSAQADVLKKTESLGLTSPHMYILQKKRLMTAICRTGFFSIISERM